MRRSSDTLGHLDATRLAKENKSLQHKLEQSFAALDGYLEANTSLEHKLQERNSELDRLRRVVQTAVEHGLHDSHRQPQEKDLNAEEAYTDVKQLAVLLAHDLEQVRVEKHDRELAYQQKVSSQVLVSDLLLNYLQITLLEEELQRLHYDLREAYTHIDALEHERETNQQPVPARPEVPEDGADASPVLPQHDATSSVTVHEEAPEYDAREDMQRLRAQVRFRDSLVGLH